MIVTTIFFHNTLAFSTRIIGDKNTEIALIDDPENADEYKWSEVPLTR